MQFEIKHNNITKQIEILNPCDLDELFQYKDDIVDYLLDYRRLRLIITDNQIKDVDNNFLYEKNDQDNTRITFYQDSLPTREDDYEAKKIKKRIAYGFKRKEKETKYINGKTFSVKTYLVDEKIEAITYYNMRGIDIGYINKKYLIISNDFIKKCFNSPMDDVIKNFIILPSNIKEMDWNSKVLNQMKKDQSLFK